jgi:hypothetical protein
MEHMGTSKVLLDIWQLAVQDAQEPPAEQRNPRMPPPEQPQDEVVEPPSLIEDDEEDMDAPSELEDDEEDKEGEPEADTPTKREQPVDRQQPREDPVSDAMKRLRKSLKETEKKKKKKAKRPDALSPEAYYSRYGRCPKGYRREGNKCVRSS